MKKATLTAVVALSFLVVAGAPVAAKGPCTSAVIAEPFVLPDGTEHPAGEIKLCVHQQYSPVSALHATYVNGMPVGLHASRHTTSRGGDAPRSIVVFDRRSDGRLSLLGYASARGGKLEVYALQHPKARRGDDLARLARALNQPDDSTLLIAAALR